MAIYKYSQFIAQSQHESFDTLHSPGTSPAHSGIYKCEGCGKEISHNANTTLPPQNHHQHAQNQGAIRWRMVVYAQTS